MAEKQALGEAPSEFATRLDTLNADLKASVGDDQLKTILTRGVLDNELKKFLAGEMASNGSITFIQLVQKIDNYVMACKVTHPDDDVEAMLAGTHSEVDGMLGNTTPGGRGGGKGGGRGGRFGRGHGRGGGATPECYFCGKGNHFARECRLLLPSHRTANTTAEEHKVLNEKRDQVLGQKVADKKAYYLDMIKKDTGVDAKQADVAEEFAFPAENGVDGRMAEIDENSESESDSELIKKKKVKKNKRKADKMKRTLMCIIQVAFAIAVSGGGAVVALGVLYQAAGADATVTNVPVQPIELCPVSVLAGSWGLLAAYFR